MFMAANGIMGSILSSIIIMPAKHIIHIVIHSAIIIIRAKHIIHTAIHTTIQTVPGIHTHILTGIHTAFIAIIGGTLKLC